MASSGRQSEFLSVGEVAARLQVSDETVRRWVREGQLASRRVGRQFRIYAQDVERFIAGAPQSGDEVAGVWDPGHRSRLPDPEQERATEPADRATAKQQAVSAFTSADAKWGKAIRRHQMAPPDPGFADRLREFAEAAGLRSYAARLGNLAGLKWVPVPDAMDARVPYELRPETGRRGPRELWAAFDAAVIGFNAANADTDLGRLADASQALSDAATALANAVEEEDREASARGATGRRAR
jgi:excisionase family DNA binding protein